MRRIDLRNASVARSNTIRDINRQIVLNYVREQGPISRAEIARETNLQRSTISLIVNELREFGLVDEIFGESSGGRPPALLTLPTSKAVAIGVDVGTVRTAVATCDLTGRVIDKEEFLTDSKAEKVTAAIIKCIENFIRRDGSSIEGIGVSVPALVNAEKGEIVYSPHFDWRRPKMIPRIEQATGLTVTVDNDANAAALAELWFGRPEIRDVRDFILVFIEAGIGTGIVSDGRIYRGKGGVAGEFGHMRIGTGAPVSCGTGSRECWEAFASERAALARYKVYAGRHAAESPSFGELIDLAFQGNEPALKALEETAHYVGIGMGNLIQGLSPEAIIVGGTMVRAWTLISAHVRKAAEGVVCQGIPTTQIIASTLGSQPTLMGAFSLVLADKFASISI